MDIDVTNLPFVAFADRNQIPHASAVYFVLDETDSVIYVGRSVDIRNRWRGHHLLAELRHLEGIRIAWYQPERGGLLAEIEAVCIDRFSPRLNMVGGARRRFAVQVLQRVGLPVRMPVDLKRSLEVIAGQEGRSLNSLMTHMLRGEVERKHRPLPDPAP
jgi:hypothetical protein